MNKNAVSVVKSIGNIIMSDKGQEFLCGKYSNGDTRSLADALRDEYRSPETREKMSKKDKKKKKKKKKGKAQNVDIFKF